MMSYGQLQLEQMLQEMGKKQGLNFVISRLGTIFGTSIGMRFHTAVNKFCWQAVLGEPLTVWKTALGQKRPYLGINDAVNSIKFFIEKDLFKGEIYNIVTSNCSVSEVIHAIKNHIQNIYNSITVQVRHAILFTI